jgi:hypothetical protein
MMKARENRAFIVRDNSLGQDWEIMTGRKGLQHDLVTSLAKKRPRMYGARSSGVTGTVAAFCAGFHRRINTMAERSDSDVTARVPCRVSPNRH